MTVFDQLQDIEILREEHLSKHTSFRVGGPAEFFALPKTAEELTILVNICHKENVPLTILGDGTNVLISDSGLRGVVVTTSKMNKIECLGNRRIKAQAGARLAKVAEAACKAEFAGFEFASGIPGTVGGAVCMNAGAYDHDIAEFCESVTMLHVSNIQPITIPGTEMGFAYRKSIIHDNPGELLVLEAIFQLLPGTESDIRTKMRELNNRRRQSQPLEFASAGSTFKRPPGHYAGKLIQDSGLKGFAIGGAMVSEKHAGFVVNADNATAQDIYELIKAVQNRVLVDSGVWLEPEVRIMGFS